MNDVLIKLAEISAVQKQQTDTLEKYAEIQSKQNEILLRNTITVEEHHKRSLYLETKQQELEDKFEEELKPLKEQAAQLRGIGSFLTWAGTVIGVIAGAAGIIYAVIKFFTTGL